VKTKSEQYNHPVQERLKRGGNGENIGQRKEPEGTRHWKEASPFSDKGKPRDLGTGGKGSVKTK